MKKKLLSLALTAVMAVMMGTPAWAYKNYIDFPYEDVPSNHWARLAVNFCWKNDITEGVSETEFDPDGTLTKAQFITMMGRNLYIENVQSQVISSDNWYSSYVRYLSNNGYLDGVAIDEDSLSQGISRQEMALIMYNMCKEYNLELDFDYSNALSNVIDASSIGSNYAEAVKFCYYLGLLSGYEDGSFDPSGTLSRAEGATVFMRTYYWANLTSTSRTTLLNNGIPEEIVNQTICNLIIENINDWREENGLKKLQTLEPMNSASMVRAEEISVSFSHTRPDGRVGGTVYEDLLAHKWGTVKI